MHFFSPINHFFSKQPLTDFYKSVECTALTANAGIAQLVEHNLAKVGVASSSLVSRSNISYCISDNARVVKSVDTRDLKSLAFRSVPVQVWPRAPFKIAIKSAV